MKNSVSVLARAFDNGHLITVYWNEIALSERMGQLRVYIIAFLFHVENSIKANGIFVRFRHPYIESMDGVIMQF